MSSIGPIKELESLGIGRPSTYAAIMGNIQNRGYARKVNGALIPTFTAYAVVQFLETNFTDMVNLQYTANLENTLDAISRNEMKSEEFLTHFYNNICISASYCYFNICFNCK